MSLWILIPILIISIVYCAMVFGFIVGLIRASRVSFTMSKVPVPMSVIVPIRNEEENIESFLDSISRVDYPWELFEIILVNDNSTDRSLDIAMQQILRFKNLKIVDLPSNMSGKKRALAYGVSMAQHRIVVFTDVDCEFSTEWLSEISNSYRSQKWCMLIGPVIISPTSSVFEKIQALEYASLTASGIGACALGFPIMASSANLAFDKKSTDFELEMLNPCQPSGDDVFLLHNLKQKKCHKISYLHTIDSVVRTKPVKTLRQFLTQRSRWASKAPAYTDRHTIAVAIIVMLLNLSLFGLIVAVLLNFSILPYLLLLYVIKSVADYPMLRLFLKQYNATNLLLFFLPLQLVYPIYVVMAFLISQIQSVKWKDREM